VNTDQACRRLKSILKSLRWGGSGDPVFGRDSVYVTVAPAADYLQHLQLPAAFVRPGSMRTDREEPDLIVANLGVRVVVSVPGDKVGERPLIGANRTSKTAWGGRGILEVEREMLNAVEKLDASKQFRIHLRAASALDVELLDSGYHAMRDYGFDADLTTDYQHQEPRAVAASEAGGTVTISWTAPDDVTGLVAYVVRRASGTIPVGFPADGTSVAWTVGTSTTDAPGSGTYTYSVFAVYDDEGGAVLMDYSDYGAVTITF